MKTYIYFIWIMVFPLVMQAQYSWERHSVGATGGLQSTGIYTTTSTVQHYEASQLNNSTYSGNTGFLFPETILLDIVLDVKAILESPFNGTNMNATLNTMDQLPLSQPYNTSPWNYSGAETVGSIPNTNVVDWVLIEIRDASDAESANASTIVEQQAAFLLNNGSVVGLDGTSILSFNHSLIHSLFLVVHHRNHLKIMSANALVRNSGIYSYDFSVNVNMAHMSGEKLVNGKAVMFGGDANADGNINTGDRVIWVSEVGTKGYLKSDANLNGQSDNKDKNDIWAPNNGEETQLPE